ncbi:MAG: type IV secretion system protein [Gammaproteobacteria bacterium]|nr:MAG: type IV secretion system protein [Gammaproteobacteria bacterium]
MGFFATFWTWLNGQLSDYVGSNAARVAQALEPAIVTLGTVYVMVWGYLHLTGRIDEPFGAGLKRLVTLAVVLGGALHLWFYNSVIVDTFYRAPTQLAAALVGSPDPVSTIDAIWDRGGAVADYLWNSRGFLGSGPAFALAGAIVWTLMGLLCVYTMFLIALSSIALAVLLALGPLFMTLLLFEGTRRFFEAWLAQLANYALITILTVLTAALLLQVVESFAAQTAARGNAITTVDALNMVLIAVLVFLLMRQVMPIAAALAGGMALSSFGTVSRFVTWGLRQGTRTSFESGRFIAKQLATLTARPREARAIEATVARTF